MIEDGFWIDFFLIQIISFSGDLFCLSGQSTRQFMNTERTLSICRIILLERK